MLGYVRIEAVTDKGSIRVYRIYKNFRKVGNEYFGIDVYGNSVIFKASNIVGFSIGYCE